MTTRNNKTLKVKAVPGALQPNFEAFEAGVRRFIGWKFDASLGEVDKKGKPSGGFVALPDGETVPYRAEYVKAVKKGMLTPVDEETASLCGVIFADVYFV